jgi:hypothetical protein
MNCYAKYTPTDTAVAVSLGGEEKDDEEPAIRAILAGEKPKKKAACSHAETPRQTLVTVRYGRGVCYLVPQRSGL